MSSITYFLRVNPPSREGDPPRVPAHVRERIIEGLSQRFDARPMEHWEGIEITSIDSPPAVDFDRTNMEMHERLGAILADIDPDWGRHYVLIPALRKERRFLPRRHP